MQPMRARHVVRTGREAAPGGAHMRGHALSFVEHFQRAIAQARFFSSGTTVVPTARHTRTGSLSTSAAESFTSGRIAITL